MSLPDTPRDEPGRGADCGSRSRVTGDTSDERTGRRSSGGAPSSLALTRLSLSLGLGLLLFVLLGRVEGIDAR